jgi:hypothetical protein
MISIENFYWILYEHLLKPSGLDATYYYPFGTRQYLSRADEFKPNMIPKGQHHVLFHFDQEPIWDDNFGRLYDGLVQEAWSQKLLRVLANSEHSDLKKTICKRRGHLDWYFFYHGFAALDWFRDSQYVVDQHEISNVYLSLNHLVTGRRAYRLALLCKLSQHRVLDKGAISFHCSQENILEELRSDDTYLALHDVKTIAEEIGRIQLPRQIDHVEPSGLLSARFGHREYKMWQRSFVHLVNETVFYDKKLHLTEKIFKPIVSLRPFILVGAPGNLAYLKHYGFQTFSDWIDESYDLESDPEKRLNMIASEVSRLCQKPLGELRSLHKEMMPVLEFNRQHFFGNFRRIIVDEMVENFDACVRIWNNGRVDGRQRPRCPDLEHVKQLLLR